MRFGGHETFSLREGWLHKGLRLLVEDAEALFAEVAADRLGVGRNMAKSIRFWLRATELAEPSPIAGVDNKQLVQVTPLGRLVRQHDPYFLLPGTWWALHVNLVNSTRHALAWSWFFNRFELRRFERAVCLERLTHYLRMSERRVPSVRTLQRDIACLLSSYAQPIPPKQEDPEDSSFCPLMELGVLTYFRSSGHYQLHSGQKDIHPYLFCYALSKMATENTDGDLEISVQDATRSQGGPGRAFVLTAETLFDTALIAEARLPKGIFAIKGQAGERLLHLERRSPTAWLEEYYEAMAAEAVHAA